MDLDSSPVITINEDDNDRCGEVGSGNSLISCLKNKMSQQFFTNTSPDGAGGFRS
jgi:hypothetical protein